MDDDGQPPGGLPPVPDQPAMGDLSGSEPPPPPPPSHRGRWVAAAAVAVALVTAIGGVGAFLLLRGSGEQLFDKIPADADAVVAIYLDPAASQKVNLLRMADEIPSLGTREDITGQIEDAIDQSLSSVGLSHEDLDWIGSEVAVTMNFPEATSSDIPAVTALIAADDEAAASATLTTLREEDPSASGWQHEDHDGIDVWVGEDDAGEPIAYALVDGVVVLTNSAAAVDDVIAASGGEVDTLAASSAFQEATVDLPEGRLALAYADPSSLAGSLAGLPGAGLDPSLPDGSLDALSGFAMSVSAEPDGLAIDAQITYDPDRLTPELQATLTTAPYDDPLLHGVPSDSLVVMSQGWLAPTFAATMSQLEDVAPKIAAAIDPAFLDSFTGDVALAVMPTEPGAMLSGAVMVGTDDEAAMEATIRSLVDVGWSRGVRWRTQDHGGVEVTTLVDRDHPAFAFSYAVADGVGVLGASPEAVFAVIDTSQGGSSVASSAAYLDAMSAVPSGATSVYVDIDGLADAIRAQVPPGQVDEFNESAGSTMDHLDTFVLGVEASETSQHVRMLLRVG
jgi:hypothetical protein